MEEGLRFRFTAPVLPLMWAEMGSAPNARLVPLPTGLQLQSLCSGPVQRTLGSHRVTGAVAASQEHASPRMGHPQQ